MRCVAHISDLHFGTEEPKICAALVSGMQELRPDLIAVSGDFTQRARANQFRAARAFLDTLPLPRICVPGKCRAAQRIFCGVL